MVPASFRVADRVQETADTWTLDLQPRHADALPDFAPGQFAMLYAFGVGEVPISVSGDLAAGGSLVHTIRAVGAVTSRSVQALPGQDVGVRGPFGTPVAGGGGRGRGRRASWPAASGSPRCAR